MTADDGDATEDPLQSVRFTLNSHPSSFFCRTVPCSIQQCWTRPPHQSKLHIRFCFVTWGGGAWDEAGVVTVENSIQFCRSQQ